ncbi:MAG: LemA family protein [Planctomycetes bacterium]|nr:LemA family protein [Planctomycetota bacterium]
MIWLLLSLPLACVVVAYTVVRGRVSRLQKEELAHVVFALDELDELLRIRRDCLPELLSICRVFTDYQRATLTKLRELHGALLKQPDTKERILIENAISEFVRDLVKQVDTHPGLAKNVFLQQLLGKIFDAEARIADRRSRLNLRVDEYNAALETPLLAKVGAYFALTPFRRLEMTAQELLKATSPFSGDGPADEPQAGASADGDEFDLSEDVDEFGGELDDIPQWTPTDNGEEESDYSAATRADADDELRFIEVDDDDSLISAE